MNDYLSPIESIMWRVGQDPTLRMTVGALMVLDRAPGPSPGEQLASAARRAPRLRQRPDDLDVHARPSGLDRGRRPRCRPPPPLRRDCIARVACAKCSTWSRCSS